MIKVKLLSKHFENWPILRQTPRSEGIWGNIKFIIDRDCEDYDWLVIYDGINKKEKLQCSSMNTIFFTGEPPSVKKYKIKFLKQFSRVITCHSLELDSVINYQQSLPWMIGCKQETNKIFFSKDYDELVTKKNYEKKKLVSVISSNKAFTEGHRKRKEFVEKLKEHFGDKIDVFGKGINEVNDKWDAIADYKYHIVIENSSFPDYWTEKLTDCFLGGAFPIYFGCSNLEDYFDKDSFTRIDVDNFSSAINTIEGLIKDNTYENRIEKILKAKNKILNEYNLFAEIHKIVNNNITMKKANSRIKYIFPEDNLKFLLKKLLGREL